MCASNDDACAPLQGGRTRCLGTNLGVAPVGFLRQHVERGQPHADRRRWCRVFWGQVGEIVLDAFLISVKSGALFHSMSGFLALVNGTRTRGRSRPLCITLGYWGAPQAIFFSNTSSWLCAIPVGELRSSRQSRCYMQLFATSREAYGKAAATCSYLQQYVVFEVANSERKQGHISVLALSSIFNGGACLMLWNSAELAKPFSPSCFC